MMELIGRAVQYGGRLELDVLVVEYLKEDVAWDIFIFCMIILQFVGQSLGY